MSQAPDWQIERSILGELDGVTVSAAQRSELEASNGEILASLPPAMVAAEVSRRRAAKQGKGNPLPKQSRSWRPAVGGLVVVAAVAFALFRLTSTGEPNADKKLAAFDVAELDGGTRIKGDIRLVVHRRQMSTAVRLAPAALAATGDLLQISYLAAGRKHGVIVSIDGRDQVSLHFPNQPTGSTSLENGRLIPLEHAYRLDDAPRFERFIFVASSQPLDPSSVVRAAQRLASAKLGATGRLELDRLATARDLEQSFFTIRKLDSE